MKRTTVTTLIKMQGGAIIHSGKNFAAYTLPIREDKFIELRKTIPFNIVWVTEKNGRQIFTVHFDQLA